jgi:hypothetical protein
MNKNNSTATVDKFFNDDPSLLDSQWHYVSVSYDGKQMGLLVETDDEDEAWQEAEDLRQAFGEDAKILTVQKVVVQ